MRMDLRDDRGNYSAERQRMQNLEDETRATNLVKVLDSKRSKSGRFPRAWLAKALIQHFERVRLEALREAASFQCQDCRECIPLEKSGSNWFHAHHGMRPGWINRRLVLCRASQLRSGTSLGGWTS